MLPGRWLVVLPALGSTLTGGLLKDRKEDASEIDAGHDSIDFMPGLVVGEKYRLIRLIGSGGMASVYEATHVLLGSPFALKFFRHESSDRPRAARRFAREARLLAKLSHENVVSLFDLGHTERGRPYLVLEYLRGQTLRQELAACGVRSVDRVLDVATQIGRGLSHAHAAGIVHRDLKPENVMLTAHADGRLLVKVLDFGVARLHEGSAELMTSTDAVIGTAAYMSPEQARGEADLDAATDVFALGVIVYEALAGVRPFDGRSYNETLYAVLNKPHRSLAEHRPDLPDKLVLAVARALAKDKRERFESVAEFLGALEQGAQGRPTSTSFSVETTQEDDDAPASRPSRRNSIRWRDGTFGALVGVGAGALFGWAVFRKGGDAERPEPGAERLAVPMASHSPAAAAPPPTATLPPAARASATHADGSAPVTTEPASLPTSRHRAAPVAKPAPRADGPALAVVPAGASAATPPPPAASRSIIEDSPYKH